MDTHKIPLNVITDLSRRNVVGTGRSAAITTSRDESTADTSHRYHPSWSSESLQGSSVDNDEWFERISVDTICRGRCDSKEKRRAQNRCLPACLTHRSEVGCPVESCSSLISPRPSSFNLHLVIYTLARPAMQLRLSLSSCIPGPPLCACSKIQIAAC